MKSTASIIATSALMVSSLAFADANTNIHFNKSSLSSSSASSQSSKPTHSTSTHSATHIDPTNGQRTIPDKRTPGDAKEHHDHEHTNSDSHTDDISNE